MTMHPIVPDYSRFPEAGRSLTETSGEIGLGAHSDQTAFALPVPLQGQGPTRLVPHPRIDNPTIATRKAETLMDDADQRIADAPLPTEAALRARSSLPYQAVRFVAFNLRMLRMVRKGHHR